MTDWFDPIAHGVSKLGGAMSNRILIQATLLLGACAVAACNGNGTGASVDAIVGGGEDAGETDNGGSAAQDSGGSQAQDSGGAVADSGGTALDSGTGAHDSGGGAHD